MAVPFIAVRNLLVTSGSRVLQRDLSFEAERGRMLAIVGDEGSGKRALLRTMIGIERPADLSLDEASQLIDAIKSSANGAADPTSA